MSKKHILLSGILLITVLSSFHFHKFYVSIYQVDIAPEKRRIEITARIFIDDLNLALEYEFKTKTNIGEKSETAEDLVLLEKYMIKHLRVAIDGNDKKIIFHNKEIENNVVILYLKINDVKKIQTLKIFNNALLELYSDQQNIIQTHFYNKKRNYIFTGDYFVENIRMK
ncbi:DUF6702 family protein [Flavobacterium sp.]|jgi:hypothetical protein|uniref:DUF6702 family protein n=1 Tax=Flavobacterium sp. TaxID=239 RepID=UPI0037C0B76B